MFDAVKTYLNRTGQTESDITSGYSFFGIDQVLSLVKEAERQNKKLVFYYATEEDERIDKLSYRFE